MRYAELLHVLRAAADHLRQADFLVIGSASVLATHREEDLPDEATRSDEADLVPFDDPEGTKADALDGALGELSLFHETYTYYAHGVSERTAYLPHGWRTRLVIVDAPSTLTPARGHCLEL